MKLPPITELTQALESRARAGRFTTRASVLSQLKLATRRMEAGTDPHDAIDAALWDAVRSQETPHLVRSQGGHLHTQEAIRCYLAVYARLDVCDALENDPALAEDRVFPDLAADADGDHARAAACRATLEGHDRDGEWWPARRPGESTVKAAIGAALTLPATGTVDKWVRLAPTLLAAELVRREALAQLPSSDGVAAKLQAVENQLEARGLLRSYCATIEVLDELDSLKHRLEAPLNDYTQPIKDFSFVIEQLDTTRHSLHGIMGVEDTTVSENDQYVARQLRALTERGITIERIFLYEDANRATAEALAKDQAGRAAEAIAEGDGEGEYRPFLVPRSVAKKVVAQEPALEERFFSMVIVDREHVSQRVLTQIFGPPHEYEASAYPLNVERACRHFDVLKGYAEPV